MIAIAAKLEKQKNTKKEKKTTSLYIYIYIYHFATQLYNRICGERSGERNSAGLLRCAVTNTTPWRRRRRREDGKREAGSGKREALGGAGSAIDGKARQILGQTRVLIADMSVDMACSETSALSAIGTCAQGPFVPAKHGHPRT